MMNASASFILRVRRKRASKKGRKPFHKASRRRQSNNRTLMNRTCQRQRLYPRPVISTLDVLELLHQSDGRVACFCECELLTDADAWSSIKW